MADFVSSLTGVQMDSALIDMAEHTSEAYAIGERNGVPVDSGDVTYHNNARYYAQQAQSIAPASVTEAVRWDVAQTALTDAQRARGRANINAADNDTSVQVVTQTFTSAQQEIARANIAAGGTNPNLLDNPWFTVNQRGVTTLSSAAFPADRWVNGLNTTTTTNANGVSITNNDSARRSFNQNFDMPWLVGKTCTASVMLQDGTIHSGTGTFPSSGTKDFVTFDGTSIRGTYGSSYLSIGLMVASGATVPLRAFKLEFGSVSTLANDTPPNYAEELRKCQYYYREFSATGTAAVGIAWAYSATAASFPNMFGIDNTMRVSPTVTASGSFSVQTQGGSLIAVTSVQKASDPTKSVLNVNFMVASGLTTNQPVRIIADNGAKIAFSADL